MSAPFPAPGDGEEGRRLGAAAEALRPPARSSSSAPTLTALRGHACGRHLAGQRCLLQGHEHRTQAGHVFALFAALGVEVTQLGHFLPLRAWGFLLGFPHESLLRCPAGGDRTKVSELPASPPPSDASPHNEQGVLPGLLWGALSRGLLPSPGPSDLGPQEQPWHQRKPSLGLSAGLASWERSSLASLASFLLFLRHPCPALHSLVIASPSRVPRLGLLEHLMARGGTNVVPQPFSMFPITRQRQDINDIN